MTIGFPLKGLRTTAIAAGIVTFILCQRHLGFLVLFETLVLAPWMIASLWIIMKKPERRALQSAKVGIWFLSLAIVIGVHYFMALNTRANAQTVVDAVLSYHASHGKYPEDGNAIGYDKEKLRSMIGMGGYFFKDGQPSFFYASTYVPYETDHYDFAKREWNHLD